MKLVCTGSKNCPTYYIQKSVRIDGKSTTKTVERLGSLDEIKARSGGKDPIEWAKEYAKALTLAEKEEKQNIIVKYSPGISIRPDERRTANIGYLFLQDVFYALGLNKICSTISSKYKFEFDLTAILSTLVYSRVIFPSSKRASLEHAKCFLENPKCSLQHIYRGLEIIAKENDYFQAQLYKNSDALISRKKEVLYYDCTNYYFEIEEDDDFRKYGVSKEHRPNPIVQMGLFMDADGIPLSFSVFSGNENEQPSMTPLEKKIISDFGIEKFVVCTDAGLSSYANRKFNSSSSRRFITTQSIKKLPKHLREYCLSDDGWHLPGSRNTYKISQLDSQADFDKTFYKDRWIVENGLDQHLIVTFSLKYKNYQQAVRKRQIERAMTLKDNPSRIAKHSPNDPQRFISLVHCTREGEIASNVSCTIDSDRIAKEAAYDGFYAVCTNLEDDPQRIIKANRQRWEIEECFRIMKSEFKARPVYLSRKDRITAHFTTCFLALVIYRILEKKLKSRYTCGQIISALREMNMLICPGYGYIPAYSRTEITDALHDAFGFRTDYQIITQRNMKKICSGTKCKK